MSVEITWEQFGVYRRFYGAVEASDLLVAVSSVHGDERFEQCSYTINDFLAVTEVNVHSSDVLRTAMQTIKDSKMNPKLRMAVVAGHSDVRRLAELFVSPSFNPYPAEIVETIPQAREWLSSDTPA